MGPEFQWKRAMGPIRIGPSGSSAIGSSARRIVLPQAAAGTAAASRITPTVVPG